MLGRMRDGDHEEGTQAVVRQVQGETIQMTYDQFLTTKRLSFPPCGFEPHDLNPHLFSWQRPVVEWSCRKGKAALWEGCGLGKTIQQLEWARQVVMFSNAPVLILAPLAVAEQTTEEAQKFGFDIKLCRSQSDCGTGINITNYEMLQHFDCDRFAGVVLDESSILKDYSSRTRNELIQAFQRTPFKLACSATPAPNDHMELANHAEFLGVMTRTEMLSMFFVHDGGDTSKWRLKGHAVDEFWKWVASWAVMIQKPSDIGFEDDGYILPELRWKTITVESRGEADTLFGYEASDLIERRQARKESISDRVMAVAEMVNSDPESQWLIWCDLNDESAALSSAIHNSIEVRGSHPKEFKEWAARWFTSEGNECRATTQITGGDTTSQIEIKNYSRQRSINGSTPNKENGTCRNGSPKTNSTSKNTSAPDTRRGTRKEENDTTLTKNSETSTRQASMSGSGRTQTSDWRRDYPVTESRSINIDQYLKDNPGYAQSVEGLHLTEDSSDYISTIATHLGLYGDSCAQNATSESESSTTIQNVLKSQRHTFGSGRKILISKASIFGYGMNFQNCHKVVFCGLSDSFEQVYQAVRRCWRFGQVNPVDAYIVTSEAEGAVVRNINRKQADFDRMSARMVEHMKAEMWRELKATGRQETKYNPQVTMTIPNWMKEDAA